MKTLSELNLPSSGDNISLSSIEEAVISFSELTNVPVTFYSPQGDILWEHNESIKICKANSSYCNPASRCRTILNSAMNISLGLGEVYIFVCNAGLINLAYALKDEDELLGYFIAGPMTMGTDREKTLKHFYNKVNAEDMNFPLLMSLTNNIRIYNPTEITHMMTLYGCLFNIPVSSELKEINTLKAQELMMEDAEADGMQPENFLAEIYSGRSDVITKALAYIHENYMNKLSLGDIARGIHVNNSYLSTLFKKEMKTTVTGYIQDVRLNSAIKKLDNTNMSITEISSACGFDNPSYFSKVFRDRFGITPRDYRKG